MTIKMADQTRITRASQPVLLGPVIPAAPVHQQRAAVHGEADHLGDDHDAAGEQGGCEDKGQRPIQKTHARFPP